MIGLLKSENKSKAELIFNKYGKTMYNDDGNLKSEIEMLEILSDTWEITTVLDEIEKYKIIANRTKSWRIRKKNKKRYNVECTKIGYSEII